MAALVQKPCSFNAVAPYYPWIESLVFGRKLTRARNAALDQIPAGANILLLGEGNGRFLTELLLRHPNARITCVEPSEGMRASQHKRLQSRFGKIPDTLTYIPQRIQDWTAPPASYDAIVAHFFLDLFTDAELPAVVEKITHTAAPHATLCIAEFAELPTRFGRLYSRALIRTMYAFFSVATRLQTQRIPNWPQALLNHGWSQQSCTPHNQSLIRAQTWTKSAPA